MARGGLIEGLSERIGSDAIASGDAIGKKHFVDFSGEHPCAPVAVVKPRSTDELSAILSLCSEHGQPVVVQGGLTGLSGGATPKDGEVAISMERMSGIEELDEASMTATVLSGTPLQRVQEAAAANGFLFPLDLGARGSCTIGGNIATNAGGNQVIRFGMMRNLVLGLEAVLADGTVVSSMNKMLKNNAGYDLKHLFIGSEGTLGVVTRAVLRLFPKLPAKTTALCAVKDFDALAALLHHLQGGLAGCLSAFEAMWDAYFHYVVDHVEGLRSPFEERHPIYVLVETEGSDARIDGERFENVLAGALDAGLVVDAALAQSRKDAAAFWSIRDGIAEISPMLQPLLAFDVSIPIADMPRFLGRVERELRARFDEITCLVFGHVGDSNLHICVTTGHASDFDALCGIVYSATGELAGSVSAEHGIGALKRGYLHISRSPEELALMRRLKASMDPKGILNRGRVILD